MKKKVLAIGTLAAAVVLAGGFAFAQSTGQGPGGFGPQSMREGRMGHGMHSMMGGMRGQMGQGMHGGGMRGQMGQGMHDNMHDNMRGRMGGMMHGGQGARFADPAEIADLKEELGITAAQEAAWTTYTKVLQDTASTVTTTREGVDRDAVARMTPQERFAFVTRMREQAQARHETLAAAAKELLATLDEDQKEIAEDALPGLVAVGPGARGAGMGGRGMGGRHRH
jgi:hypothetical protein